MYLSKFLKKLIKKDGFVLIDANLNRHVIGKSQKENPITVKLLDKKLHYKLLLFPDLYFGEAYTEGSLKIENGNLTEFLDLVLKNIGRNETNKFSDVINKIRGTYSFLTNFNLITKS